MRTEPRARPTPQTAVRTSTSDRPEFHAGIGRRRCRSLRPDRYFDSVAAIRSGSETPDRHHQSTQTYVANHRIVLDAHALGVLPERVSPADESIARTIQRPA